MHHRLLDIGLPQATVTIIIYAITIVGASIGVLMLAVTSAWSIGLLAGGIVFVFTVFVCLGAARIRETIGAIRHIRATTRKKKEDKHCFEDLQLRMSDATSFSVWWESMCIMAKRMQFQNLQLCLGNNGHAAAKYEWSLAADENEICRTAEFTLPLGANGRTIRVA